MRIGFIGLGRMGVHMARHLALAGHELSVFDLRAEAADALSALSGVTVARSYSDVSSGREVVFTSLPGPREVEDVVLGEAGLLDSMPSGSIYVDLSTNAPSTVRRLAATLADHGIGMLDAPVSGGIPGAEDATLSIMAGGERDVFERARPLLATIGSKLFYCGNAGAGSVVKLCNNICGAGYGLILTEALTLGVKAGVDLETLTSVIGASTGASVRLTNRFPKYLFQRNFEPGFSVALSTKDTQLALDLAQEHDVPMAAGTLAREELQRALDRGWADLDFDATARLQEERSGVVLELPQA